MAIRHHLLDLPEEILICIVSFVTDHEDLKQLILVNRHLNTLAEPFLYQSVDVTHGSQASALAKSISRRRVRAKWIKCLLVSTRFGDDVGLTQLPPCIMSMQNLKQLRLETPDCNQKPAAERVSWIALQERYERIFESASALVPEPARLLPSLTSCTLHFVDAHKEIYLLSKYAMLFLHPKLQDLTVSCASTDFPKNLLSDFQGDPNLEKSTALEYLHLEECDVFGPSLAILLSFAKCLKRLKLSEGVRYTPRRGFHPRLHGNINPADLVEALSRHCGESLEWLSLSLGYTRDRHHHINQSGHHLNLSAFTNIRHLQVDMVTVFLLVPLRYCDHNLWRRLPPRLTSLKVFDIVALMDPPFSALGREYWPFHDCVVKEKVRHGLQHLQKLTYSFITHAQENADPMDEQMFEQDDDEEFPEVETNAYTRTKAKLIAAAATSYPMFKRAGVSLEVVLVSLPPGYIPPYLNAEDRPVEKVIWDRPV